MAVTHTEHRSNVDLLMATSTLGWRGNTMFYRSWIVVAVPALATNLHTAPSFCPLPQFIYAREHRGRWLEVIRGEQQSHWQPQSGFYWSNFESRGIRHHTNSPVKPGTRDQRHGARARRNPGVCGKSRAFHICMANEWSLSQGVFTWVFQGPPWKEAFLHCLMAFY